jgi:hypothetical protein
MPRRFITKQDIDEFADQGRTQLEVDDQVTVTDLAHEHARARGVRIVAVDAAPSGPSSGRAEERAEPSGAALRSRVRAAVIAQLGKTPEDLDTVLDRVLDRHGRA